MIACGELYCDRCGDCYACYADDPCYDDGGHSFSFSELESEDEEEEEK